jgi:hypothetical protein
MATESDKMIAVGFSVAFVAVLIPLTALYHGFVISTLWRWFAVPLFAAPSVTAAQAAGLVMLAGMFRLRLTGKQNLGWGDWLAYFVAPLIALAVGWLFSFSV